MQKTTSPSDSTASPSSNKSIKMHNNSNNQNDKPPDYNSETSPPTYLASMVDRITLNSTRRLSTSTSNLDCLPDSISYLIGELRQSPPLAQTAQAARGSSPQPNYRRPVLPPLAISAPRPKNQGLVDPRQKWKVQSADAPAFDAVKFARENRLAGGELPPARMRGSKR